MYENIDRSDLHQFGFDGARFKKAGRGELHGPCLWCGGKDRMVISKGMYWCRQCNKGGSLAKLLKEPLSFEEMERLRTISLAKEKRERDRIDREKTAKLKILNRDKPWVQFHKNLMDKPDILQQLEKDGITMKAVEFFQLGYVPKFRYWADGVEGFSPGIVFPIKNGKGMHNLRIRLLNITEGDKYRPFMSDVGAGFFKADFPDEDWVVIVEGEKKAIVCWLNGIPAVGIQGCWTFKEEWLPWFKKRYKQVFIALDPDPGGVAGAKRLAEMLHAPLIVLEGKPDDLFVQGKLTTPQFVSILSKSIYLLKRR